MPQWDDLDREDELARLIVDIDAAERLIAELPPRSRDRELVERTVDALNARVRLLLGVDETSEVAWFRPDRGAILGELVAGPHR
jgi:hypothetical protein